MSSIDFIQKKIIISVLKKKSKSHEKTAEKIVSELDNLTRYLGDMEMEVASAVSEAKKLCHEEEKDENYAKFILYFLLEKGVIK